MVVASKMDECGKIAWIAAVVLGFWLFWPLGLAVLGYLIFSGRVRAWRHEAPGRWYNTGGGSCGWNWGARRPPTSGNAAFDEYRAETLRRLEEEQREFVAYLERLRRAKDKAEFDQFMAERRNRPPAPETPPTE
ncbi:MAG TPA: DUF2852 domain-containing protein [Acetobacteraceae bacterium]|nr:DUF2852 domain-containing protein [Acetobacteraceae bacterium]